ncbi:S-+-linalool synthase [Cinnamomum micranthum f. kanehirae]|uniref:S-+-linalool synthase n=1 Tax=Cinnamomum micranthum f. kanehirae TaxID=337451 RepID=A0A3S3NM43_9MAGN|nr:S-+-linalool synthase [Cinnamomum micranthum f. kanehirae]
MAFCSRLMAFSSFPINPSKVQSFGRRRITVPQVASGHWQRTTQDPDMDTLSIKCREKINQVRHILQNLEDPSGRLVMIDHLQRLGIDHHFPEEIESFISSEYNNLHCGNNGGNGSSIYDVSLTFRLLREHGYYVSSDIFNNFKDDEGSFKPSLGKDIKGMMSLYEASEVAIQGEDILDEANDFAKKSLFASLTSVESSQTSIIRHALENPFHMSLPRFSTKHHLKNLRGNDVNTKSLQELAKLDFNIVQLMHQEELKQVSKWWRDLGLSQELKFARDQPLKWFMWPLAVLSNPQFSKYRVELTKPISFIYIIDDIFDVYGTPDELILFTEAVNRWDPSDIDQLPRYMKICFMALYNLTNEIAFMVLKEHGWNPIDSLRKSWTDLCNAFLVESKWFASGHLPKADEYLRNGVTSSGVHVVLVHIFFLVGHGITRKGIDSVDNIPGLITFPATILRLWDDLGSAKDENQEGYDGSYVDCYMKEHGTSLESARQHVRQMISNAWKGLNKECLSPNPFSQSFVNASLNTARMVQVMYSYDKDQRLPVLEEFISTLLKESIPL